MGIASKGKKYGERYWLYYLSSKGENRASASTTAEDSSSDNVLLIHMAKTTKRKQVVSPSPSIEAPQNLALVCLEEEEVSDHGELQRKKKRKINSSSTSKDVDSDELKERETAEETSIQNQSPQQFEQEIPPVQSLPTSSQPHTDDANNKFWQLYYNWRAWKVGNSEEQLLDWDQQLKNEKIIKKCLGLPVNHCCEDILDDYWVWQRNNEDLHLEHLATTPISDFEADDEDTAVYKPVFSKATEDQMAPTSEEIAVLETTAEDFPIFTETSPAFEMVLTETVQEKAASPPQEQNQEATEEEEFQRLIQSQVLEILTTPCENFNQTQLEILEKSAEIPEQLAIPEIMEKEVEVQRHSGKAERESQMAEEEEAYKLFRLIGANSGNRKMEVILQQHSPSPIPQLPIAVKEGEVSYIPSHLNMTNLILEAQQRNPENSAQHLSSSRLDGTEFIGTVVDHFSNDAQSEERRENLRRIKELCGNMKGISEVARSSKRKRN
ncbi:unnamed protein product [Cuscuta campestris]|uniref:Uncharacterized protein n=1 Tax=Cuscuta campestris TaxID=132261 RepID=A0A484LQS7_9ASTE|nr:unnamed protein product [Cuscuta campestris]